LRWTSPEKLGPEKLFLTWGTEDRAFIRETNEDLLKHLLSRGISVEGGPYEGNHSWVSWNPVVVSILATQLNH
ncbi:MAG: hypothetical protein KC416_09145, partial [Myxococcales bacterium]|nr:hypothetical protein [Myxococcales bacterium]